MESAFEPKPNVKAPSAIKIAVLSMCSPPCNDDDHSCRRKHDRLPPSNSRVRLRFSACAVLLVMTTIIRVAGSTIDCRPLTLASNFVLHALGLLRARGERPYRRAAEQRDEVAPPD